jgi:hypothetical protein
MNLVSSTRYIRVCPVPPLRCCNPVMVGCRVHVFAGGCTQGNPICGIHGHPACILLEWEPHEL